MFFENFESPEKFRIRIQNQIFISLKCGVARYMPFNVDTLSMFIALGIYTSDDVLEARNRSTFCSHLAAASVTTHIKNSVTQFFSNSCAGEKWVNRKLIKIALLSIIK